MLTIKRRAESINLEQVLSKEVPTENFHQVQQILGIKGVQEWVNPLKKGDL